MRLSFRTTTTAATALYLYIALVFAVPSANSFTVPLPFSAQHLHQHQHQRARVDVDVDAFSRQIPFKTTSRSSTCTSISLARQNGVSTSPNSELSQSQSHKQSQSSSSHQSQTVDESVDDIIRDLDGHPLSKEYFAEKMGIPIANVDTYECCGSGAFRGLMSNACRVRLEPGGETAFYKHVVFQNLDHAQEKLKKAPHKLLRDAKSYQVVASFLLSKACQQMTETTGVSIPKCLDAKLKPNFDNPMESKFSFLFQDYAPKDGWYQQWLLLDVQSCQTALSTFAKIHAFFWSGADFWDPNNNAEAAQELEEAVWPSGSYVQPIAQDWGQCQEVAKEWATKRMKFKTHLSRFDYWDNLGDRLQSIAEECGRLAHPFADDSELAQQYQKYRTFTHGDPKQANLLFRKTTQSDEHGHNLQLGLIDFQWSGFGLAATDIAHFITSAVHADMLVDGGEDRLLRYYFDELQTYLVEYGAFRTPEDARKSYSFHSDFMEQYEIAVLDICRLMIAYTWERFEEPVDKDDEAACNRTMNKTSYNKSIPNIVWLMCRCDELMKARGVE